MIKLSLFLSMHSPINHKIKPSYATMLKLHFFFTNITANPVFYVSFPDVFIMVYILCMFCVIIDNIFEATLYEDIYIYIYIYIYI